jgi:hypothetical protein
MPYAIQARRGLPVHDGTSTLAHIGSGLPRRTLPCHCETWDSRAGPALHMSCAHPLAPGLRNPCAARLSDRALSPYGALVPNCRNVDVSVSRTASPLTIPAVPFTSSARPFRPQGTRSVQNVRDD